MISRKIFLSVVALLINNYCWANEENMENSVVFPINIDKTNLSLTPNVSDFVFNSNAENYEYSFTFPELVTNFSGFGYLNSVDGSQNLQAEIFINAEKIKINSDGYFFIPYTVDNYFNIKVITDDPSNTALNFSNFYATINKNGIPKGGVQNVKDDLKYVNNFLCEELHPKTARSVVYLSFSGDKRMAGCTGNLVNNEKEDGVPYILTAEHCLQESSSNANNVKINVAFHRENSCGRTINSYDIENIVNVPNAIVAAHHFKNDFSKYSYNPETDYLLLKLPNLPFGTNPYFAGVDFDANPQYAYDISHANGSNKSLTVLNYKNNGFIQQRSGGWRLQFDEGDIIAGSSGSGVFSENDLIFGGMSAVASGSNVTALYNLKNAPEIKQILSPNKKQLQGLELNSRSDSFDFFFSGVLPSVDSKMVEFSYYTNGVTNCTLSTEIPGEYNLKLNSPNWEKITLEAQQTITMVCENQLMEKQTRKIDLSKIQTRAPKLLPTNITEHEYNKSKKSRIGSFEWCTLLILFVGMLSKKIRVRSLFS